MHSFGWFDINPRRFTFTTYSLHPTVHRSTHHKMPDANGMILAKEEENEAEVRREDQEQINEFGRLNARLHDVRYEVDKLKVSV